MEIIRPFKNLPALKHEFINENFVDSAFIPQFLNNEEINRITTQWDSVKLIDGGIKKEKQRVIDYSVRNSKIMYLEEEGNEWLYDKLAVLAIMINASKFKFDISGFQAKLQLANYCTGEFFGWHTDHGAGNVSIRKLSISIQLSDPEDYEGGELEFLTEKGDNTLKTKGSVIIFPSFIIHRVAPIISGNRMSLVGWIGGPAFR